MRASVFIGSSAEGIGIANAIQQNIDYECDATVWSQGVFGLSGGTLESLVERVDEFDFAVLVLTPDDLVDSRKKMHAAPRDNVLFELGLFVGSIGRKRTFIVHDRSESLKLPSDLAGVTPTTYQLHASGNLRASLGAASTEMLTAIKSQGLRIKSISRDEIIQSTQFQVISDLLDEASK